MAESAANLLQDNNDDGGESPGILGMRLDTEFDKNVILPETVSLGNAFPPPFLRPSVPVLARAFPTRRIPDTVYPAPGERNRPRGSKGFDVSTWVEETTVVMIIQSVHLTFVDDWTLIVQSRVRIVPAVLTLSTPQSPLGHLTILDQFPPYLVHLWPFEVSKASDSSIHCTLLDPGLKVPQ